MVLVMLNKLPVRACLPVVLALLLLPQLYAHLTGFVADMVSGGPEVLVKSLPGRGAAVTCLVPAVRLREPWARDFEEVHYCPPAAAGAMRDVTNDSGWVVSSR